MYDFNDIGAIASSTGSMSIKEGELNENLIKFNQVLLNVNSVSSY